MMDRPTCKTCPYYDATATTVIYPPPVAGQQAGVTFMSTTIEVRGICRRNPLGGGHKRPEEWCGEHADMPEWIAANRPATPMIYANPGTTMISGEAPGPGWWFVDGGMEGHEPPEAQEGGTEGLTAEPPRPKTMVEEFVSTPEGMAEFRKETAKLEARIAARQLVEKAPRWISGKPPGPGLWLVEWGDEAMELVTVEAKTDQEGLKYLVVTNESGSYAETYEAGAMDTLADRGIRRSFGPIPRSEAPSPPPSIPAGAGEISGEDTP